MLLSPKKRIKKNNKETKDRKEGVKKERMKEGTKEVRRQGGGEREGRKGTESVGEEKEDVRKGWRKRRTRWLGGEKSNLYHLIHSHP